MSINALELLIDGEWERRGREISFRCEVSSECAWSGELRWTPEPNRDDHKPDRSVVFFASGCNNPEHVAERLVEEFLEYQAEVDVIKQTLPEATLS